MDAPKMSALACLLLLCCAVSVTAQQPGKAKDLTPFARPQPLCSLSTTNVQATFKEVLKIIQDQGFNSDEINQSDGELHASRRDRDSPNLDKLLVWLERDFQQPESRIRVYVLYGRYEQYFGSTGELTKVKVDEAFENQHVGQLRQKLIDFAATGGPQ